MNQDPLEVIQRIKRCSVKHELEILSSLKWSNCIKVDGDSSKLTSRRYKNFVKDV